MAEGGEEQDAGPSTFRSRWVWLDELPFGSVSIPIPLADFVPLLFSVAAVGLVLGAAGMVASEPAGFWTWVIVAIALGVAVYTARLIWARLQWRLVIGPQRLTGRVTDWGMFGPVPPAAAVDMALGDIRVLARRTHHSQLLHAPNMTWETFSIHTADGACVVIGGESEVSDGEPALQALRALAARTGLPVITCDPAHNANPWWPSPSGWPPWTVSGADVRKAQA